MSKAAFLGGTVGLIVGTIYGAVTTRDQHSLTAAHLTHLNHGEVTSSSL